MSLRLQIEPGGEKYFSFAKRKLDALKQMMVRSRLQHFSRHFKISESESIWIKSIRVRDGVFLDWIRITARAVGGLFELINADELVVVRDLETDPYTDEEQAIVDQADADLAARIITIDEYNAIVDALNVTPLIDPALLDPAATNYGLVLPDRVLLGDETFDTSKLLNDSFKRQHPTEYANLDWYAHPLGSGMFYIHRSRFVYSPSIEGGTMVVVRSNTNYGTASSDITEATTVIWVSQIKRKTQAVEFGAAQGADPDFVIRLTKQPSVVGPVTAVYGLSTAVGRDLRVAVPYRTSETDVGVRTFRPGEAAVDSLSTAFPVGYSASGYVALNRSDTYLLAVGYDDNFASKAVLKRDRQGVEEEIFSYDFAEAANGAIPLVLRVTDHGYGAAFSGQDASEGLRPVYFASAAGITELYDATFQPFNLGGFLHQGQVDISSEGVAAFAHMGPNLASESAGNYLVVKIDGVSVYRIAGPAGTLSSLNSTLFVRWTPDGRYLVVQHSNAVFRVFSRDGTQVFVGTGWPSVAVTAGRILPGTVVTAGGVTTRTYTLQAEFAIDADTPLARDKLMTVVEDGTDITVTFGATVERPRIWDAALGGGIWETAAVLD